MDASGEPRGWGAAPRAVSMTALFVWTAAVLAIAPAPLAAAPAPLAAAGAPLGAAGGPTLAQEATQAVQRSDEDPFAGVRAAARHHVATGELPSVAIAVARDGRIVWEEAYGWADRERGREATPHTPYSVASVTKPITATAVMMLAERGLLELDRPVNDYLGRGRLTGLAGDASAATVSRVLSHTAGLPLHYNFFYEDEPERPPSMDETIARYGIIVHPPGEAYDYSNLGYGILDHVISRVSGRSYEDFLRRELFEPLGMTRSAVGVSPALEPYAAARYDSVGRPIPAYDFDHRGASAVYASAHDLARFALFHLGALADAPPLVAESTLVRMRRVMTPGANGSGYGIGWIVREEPGAGWSVGHTGGMPGVRTVLSLYPDVGVAVVVLANAASQAVFELAREAALAALPGAAKPREAHVRARARVSGPAGSSDSARVPDPPYDEGPPAPVGAWSGELHTSGGPRPMRLVVGEHGDFRVRIGQDPAVPLIGARWHDGWLSGIARARIATTDVRRGEYALLVRLRLRDGVLSGPLTAHTIDHPMRFGLSSWARLTREGGPPP